MVAFAACAWSAGQQPIVIDGGLSDWSTVPLMWSDPAGDGGASGIDLGNLWIANDHRFLFLRFELGGERSLDEGNNLRVYIDADGQVSTGLAIAGIGAEIEWRFGQRIGTRHFPSGATLPLSHQQIRFRAGPTVTAAAFEVSIGRDASHNGVAPIFTSPTIRLALIDDSPGGDWLPDAGQIVTFTFAGDLLPPQPPIPIERLNASNLRILSHNVLDDRPWHISHWQKFARMWTTVDPDVLCLQEIYNHTTQETHDRVAGWLGGKWHAAGNADCKIVSRFPIVQSWPLDGNLAALLDTSSSLGGQTLLINAHLPCCANEVGRQNEIDRIMAFIRDALTPGGVVNVPPETAFLIAGDLNLVGLSQQQTTLLTGDIVGEGVFGPDFTPDWDGSNLANVLWQQTDKRIGYTWRDDTDTFWPGHLDYMIYADSVLTVANRFALYTPEMPAARLAQYGLLASDSLASDHLLICADFRTAQPADVNGDGAVNIDDLLIVINSWGFTGPPGTIAADVDGSGVVDIDDLLLVINDWG